MKKILVPCDFSDSAVQAFRFAIDIAQQSKGEIVLLNVIELPVLYDTVLMPSLYFEEAAIQNIKANAEKSYKKLIAKWAKAGPKVTLVTAYGPVVSTISHFVEEKKASLIVMGTHGATGLKDFFVGSNTEKIVRTSSVPVIAVKKYMKVSKWNIVFPNTLSKDQEDLAMKVKALQEFFKATLHIVFVNTPANFKRDAVSKQELKDFASRFMMKNYTLNVINDIDEESGIVHFAHEKGADMIAMATHGRRGLNHLMTGSLAEDILNHINMPIWTCVEK